MVLGDMFIKVIHTANNTVAMRTVISRLGLTLPRTDSTFKGTRSSMFIGSTFVPGSVSFSKGVLLKSSKLSIGTGPLASFKRLANLLSSLSTVRTIGASSKKGLLAVKLVSLIKTERIRNTFADHKLFSNKGFFRSIELIDNLSRKTVCALGLDTLVNEFRTCEVGVPEVVNG